MKNLSTHPPTEKQLLYDQAKTRSQEYDSLENEQASKHAWKELQQEQKAADTLHQQAVKELNAEQGRNEGKRKGHNSIAILLLAAFIAAGIGYWVWTKVVDLLR
jgi:hypothetical protein